METYREQRKKNGVPPESPLERKKRLQEELKELESSLVSSCNEIRGDLTSNMSPSFWVRRFPVPVLGAAVLLGWAWGCRPRKGASRQKNGDYESEWGRGPTDERRDGFVSLLFGEIKRVMTRRTVDFIVNKVEKGFEERRREDR